MAAADSPAMASWELVEVVPGVIMGLCCLVGIPGNLAVLVVISRGYQPGHFTLQMMLSLAVSDLLSLLFLPAQIYNLLWPWTLGEAACRLLFFAIYWSIHASVFSAALLSLQRYLQVLHTRCWRRLQASGHLALLTGAWALGALVASPCLSIRHVQDARCGVSYASGAEEAAVLLNQTVFGFLLPLCTMACLYFCLQRRVGHMVFLSTRRMTRLVTYIVVSFLVFWVPLHLFNLLSLTALASGWAQLRGVCERIWASLLALTFVNACLNPFLYAFAHSQLQRTVSQPSNTSLPTHIPMATQ